MLTETKGDIKMQKTFWSVKYRNWGADAPGVAWFDNKKDAFNFYNSRNYVDSPVRHVTRSAEKIARYTELCNQ
jgi:hypothetical protein